MTRTLIVGLALALAGTSPVLCENPTYLRTPWSEAPPACATSAPCSVVLGRALDVPVADDQKLRLPREGGGEGPQSADGRSFFVELGGIAVATTFLPRPGDAAMGIDGLNQRIADELRMLDSDRREYLPVEASLVLSPRGPVRSPLDVLALSESDLEAVLRGLGAERIAVPAAEGAGSRLERGGRVLLVGREVVELGADGGIALIEGSGRRVLVPSDAQLEDVLLNGRVVDKGPVGEGITRPWRLTIEHEGMRVDAIFKTIEKRYAGASKEGSFPTEPYFIDSYRFERAAYLLDRMLGLRLVPVTVIRNVGGADGSLTVFVEDAVQHARWDEEHAGSRPSERLDQQLEVMLLFDALILNTDRNAFNLLVGVDDLKLHAIDHSRSFRFSTSLGASIARRPPRVPDEIYRRLAALSRERVHAELDPLVGRERVNAVLARCDKLLQAAAPRPVDGPE